MRHESVPVHCDATCICIRHAETADIPALLTIEEQSFATDRMTQRNFRYAIRQAKGVVLVAYRQVPKVQERLRAPEPDVPEPDAHKPGAYGVVGFHAGTPFARLTSFAVAPDKRGQGLGRSLLAALEKAAAGHGCRGMRLEVRADNTAAIALYTAAGYRRFSLYPDYYEDGMAALRLEKLLPSGH